MDYMIRSCFSGMILPLKTSSSWWKWQVISRKEISSKWSCQVSRILFCISCLWRSFAPRFISDIKKYNVLFSHMRFFWLCLNEFSSLFLENPGTVVYLCNPSTIRLEDHEFKANLRQSEFQMRFGYIRQTVLRKREFTFSSLLVRTPLYIPAAYFHPALKTFTPLPILTPIFEFTFTSTLTHTFCLAPWMAWTFSTSSYGYSDVEVPLGSSNI